FSTVFTSLGASAFHAERRWRVFERDILRLGTAMCFPLNFLHRERVRSRNVSYRPETQRVLPTADLSPGRHQPLLQRCVTPPFRGSTRGSPGGTQAETVVQALSRL